MTSVDSPWCCDCGERIYGLKQHCSKCDRPLCVLCHPYDLKNLFCRDCRNPRVDKAVPTFIGWGGYFRRFKTALWGWWR